MLPARHSRTTSRYHPPCVSVFTVGVKTLFFSRFLRCDQAFFGSIRWIIRPGKGKTTVSFNCVMGYISHCTYMGVEGQDFQGVDYDFDMSTITGVR